MSFKKSSIIALVFMLACCVNAHLTMIVHVLLFFAALKSRDLAIKALMVLILIKFLNPSLLVIDSVGGLLYWLVFISSTLRISSGRFFLTLKNWPELTVFVVMAIFTAPLISKHPTISVFKAIVFLLVSSACLNFYVGLTPSKRKEIVDWIGSVIFLVFIISLPTLAIHSIGFLKNGRGFQGVLNHPQVYGIFLAPMLAYSLVSIMQYGKKPRLIDVVIVISVGLIIVLTQARTAFLAVFGSLFIVVMVNAISKMSVRKRIDITKFLSMSMTIVLLLGFLIALNPGIGNTIKSFALKNRGDEVGEAFYRSRGFVLERHYNNFLKSPIYGNGFGVFADDDPRDEPIYIAGIPVSAATEKGFVVLAVLEEMGLIGAILLFVFVFRLSEKIRKRSSANVYSVFWVCILVNFGEAVFFSPGGIGLYFWILIGACFLTYQPSKNGKTTGRAT